MGIVSTLPNTGRDAPCHARNRDAQALILSSVLAPGMAYDTKIAQADRACESQRERSVDQTALRFDKVGLENRLTHPRYVSSNKEC